MVTLCPFDGVIVFTINTDPEPDSPMESDTMQPIEGLEGTKAHHNNVPAADAFADVVPAVIDMVFPVREYVRLP